MTCLVLNFLMAHYLHSDCNNTAIRSILRQRTIYEFMTNLEFFRQKSFYRIATICLEEDSLFLLPRPKKFMHPPYSCSLSNPLTIICLWIFLASVFLIIIILCVVFWHFQLFSELFCQQPTTYTHLIFLHTNYYKKILIILSHGFQWPTKVSS